jgi:hypothetical protein
MMSTQESPLNTVTTTIATCTDLYTFGLNSLFLYGSCMVKTTSDTPIAQLQGYVEQLEEWPLTLVLIKFFRVIPGMSLWISETYINEPRTDGNCFSKQRLLKLRI